MKNCKWLILLGLMIVPAFAGSDKVGKLVVNLDKFDKDSGVVLVCLFNKADGFPAKADSAFKKSIGKIKNKQAQVVFDSIPFGVYAVSAMHNLDGSGIVKLDKLGLPAEGYGVSNNIRARFGPPLFSDAKFFVVIKKKEILIDLIE